MLVRGRDEFSNTTSYMGEVGKRYLIVILCMCRDVADLWVCEAK